MTTHGRSFTVVRSVLVAAALLFTDPTAQVLGQEPLPAAGGSTVSARLSVAERSAALKAIEATLRASYVVPDMQAKLVARLREAQRAGRYDRDDPYDFTERITEDLKDVSRDGHLSLRLAPAEYAAAIAPPADDDGS